ncbi:MAG: nucleotide exchange factor GrpE [Candidatus Omnitrophota bacterium]
MENKKTKQKEEPEEPKQPEKETPEPPGETVTLAKEDWQKLSEQAAKADESRDQLLRLAAEFENFRKRTDTEKQRLAGFAESVLLSKFLPILDSIEQVLKFSAEEEDKENLSAGLTLVTKELHRIFHNLGLKPLEVLGKPFDPHAAEAVEISEDPDCAEGTVLSILRTGYQYKGRILRPALVRISKGITPPKEPPGSDAKDGNSGAGEN